MTTLGKSAFYNTKLNRVTNLGTITTILTDTFRNISTLSEVILPSTILSINSNAFSNCPNLISVNFPESITSIGENAFYNCPSLLINDLNLPNLKSLGATAFNTTMIKNISNLGELESVPNYAFGNSALITADLTGIKSVGNASFSGCKSLTTVTTPDLTSVILRAFQGDSVLQSIDLSNVTYIGQEAFQRCALLGTVDLSKCKTIEKFAFSGCSVLKLKTNDKGYFDLTSLEKIETCAFEWLWQSDPAPTIDFGENIYDINGYTIFRESRANFILRCSVVPNVHGSTDSLASNKTYSKIYVLDNLVNDYKAIWTGAASQIHPLSEIEP